MAIATAPRGAIVTGASRGIGRQIAIELGSLGCGVLVNYVANEQAAGEAVAAVQQAGGKAVAVKADVSVAADRQKLVDAAIKEFGSLELLVNNAGVGPSRRDDLLDTTEESFDRVMAIDLKGPFFLSQLAARAMLTNLLDVGGRRGSIVNISSISAYAASVNRGEYCIAKAGVAMMSNLFAVRLARDGINVYEIRPGIIETDMTAGVKQKYDGLISGGLTPIQRWGTPADVAAAVKAVAMGLLAFSTGEVINVDGGFHLRSL
ncbi:MAG: 3-ketoacyl-ACP reductase [Phycisphaerae bacterium]